MQQFSGYCIFCLNGKDAIFGHDCMYKTSYQPGNNNISLFGFQDEFLFILFVCLLVLFFKGMLTFIINKSLNTV